MGKKVADYIQQNGECFKTFSKVGLVPVSVVAKFNIYIYYCGLKSNSKMQRYQDTAAAMKTNVWSVMDAVKEMQKTI